MTSILNWDYMTPSAMLKICVDCDEDDDNGNGVDFEVFREFHLRLFSSMVREKKGGGGVPCPVE